MRYICTTRNLSDHWYPKDPEKRAMVDQYLDWHHSNLRLACGGQVFKTIFGPLMGMTFTAEEIEVHKRSFRKCMRLMEKMLQGRKYLCGDDISIADLSAACELTQIGYMGYDLSQHKIVNDWHKRILAIPEVYNTHKVCFEGIAKVAARRKQAEKTKNKL